MNRIFKNKKILITGGTGSFGNAFVRKLIKYNIKDLANSTETFLR